MENDSYLEHVMTDHYRFLSTLWDIFLESTDPDAVRLAGNVLGTTKTGQDYMTKMQKTIAE